MARSKKTATSGGVGNCALRQVGVMGNYDVFGNVILLTPKHYADRIFERVSAEFNIEEEWAAGASRLPNDAGLIYKIVGMETETVRARVCEFWSIVRPEIAGCKIPRKFAWR